MITSSVGCYRMLLELFGERLREGQASPLLFSLERLKSIQRVIPPAWEPWGVYIGLPPKGTMVIRLGMGPSRLCLCPLVSPPTGGARRLVGPPAADPLADRPAPPLGGLVGGWLLLPCPW